MPQQTTPPPDAPTGFYFIRHGETTANRDRVCSGGESDPPLTDDGVAQVRAAGKRLCDLRDSVAVMPGQVLASEMQRTRDTAFILLPMLGLAAKDMRWEPGLCERRLGKWNLQPAEKIHPRLLAGETPPEGESVEEFRRRVLLAFTAAAPLYQDWPLFVGSRGIGRVLLERAGVPRKNAAGLPNAATLRFTLTDAGSFEISGYERLD